MKSFYITTPIFYPNAKPHLGHAYTTVLSDVLARYRRQALDDVYFLTGTDENTEKVVRAAHSAGKDPRVFLDSVVENFKELYRELNISYDQFIRTTDKDIHWPGAEKLWRKLDAAGDIYKKKYVGYYCTGHEAFLTEKDFVLGKCPEHDEVPEKIEEENYFFALSKYTERIKECIESGELNIIPETRKNEILSLLTSGLSDVSFSRPADKMTFGVPVPGDPTHKMYVWCDALSNYITALGYGRGEERMRYWPGMHVIGKDILRFHAAIWPGMLLSAGIALPKAIFVHGFITSGGKKMSKTLGNVIDPNELLRMYGADALRYYLVRHVSSFEDGDVTMDGFKNVYNGELANGLGNLASRVTKMSETYGVALSAEDEPTIESGEPLSSVRDDYKRHMDNLELQKAADVVWDYIGVLDKYIQDTEPYKTIKSNPEKAKKDVVCILSGLRGIAEMLMPFMPETAEKIKNALKENSALAPLFLRVN